MEGKDIEKFEKRSPHHEFLPDKPVNLSPADMIFKAISMGGDLDKLEKMLKLQREWESNEARKSFFESVSKFKTDNFDLIKDKFNQQTKSKYISAGNLLGSVNPILAKHGLSVRFEINDKGTELMTVACILSHRGGHSEQAEMSAPPDTKGPKGEPNKTEIQGRMSTLTYLMKATFSAAVGIAAIDEKFDTDGNNGNDNEPITERQLSQIVDMLNDVSANDKDINTFLKYMAEKAKIEIPKLENIPAKHFQIAVTSLQAKKREQLKKEAK